MYKMSYKPSKKRVISIIILLIALVGFLHTIYMDAYLHYKIRQGEIEIYNVTSIEDRNDRLRLRTFERIGTADEYVLIYDTKTGLVYLNDRHGGLSPYYSGAYGRIVQYDKAKNKLIY